MFEIRPGSAIRMPDDIHIMKRKFRRSNRETAVYLNTVMAAMLTL
jgi:hypothetical protein